MLPSSFRQGKNFVLNLLFILILSATPISSYTPRRHRVTFTPLSQPTAGADPSTLPPPQPLETLKTHSNIFQKEWVDTAGSLSTIPPISDLQLKIVSYNILGPLHGESMKHAYAPVSVTKWSRRREKLTEELRAMKADIMCLQEMSAKALKESFIPNLKHLGMECSGFAPGNQGESGAKGKYAHKLIGCATFVNSSKVDVLASRRVFLRDFAPLDNCHSHSFYVDVKSRYNGMVMLHVSLKETNQTLIIANTHLYWNPQRSDIKVSQTAAAINAIKKFSENCGYTKDNLPPIILCGDFNTLPNIGNDNVSPDPFMPSAPFKLLQDGELGLDHPQHPDRWFQSLGRDECPRLGTISTDIRLTNAYELQDFAGYQPLFTTKTDEFSGWIDHIWVSGDVSVDMVLAPPIRRGDLEANRKARDFEPIPDKEFPSDHLPIGIVASLKRRDAKQGNKK